MSVSVLDLWLRVNGVVRQRIKVLRDLLNGHEQEQHKIGLVWQQCAMLLEGGIDLPAAPRKLVPQRVRFTTKLNSLIVLFVSNEFLCWTNFFYCKLWKHVDLRLTLIRM